MEDSALTPVVVARIVLGAQSRAAAEKARADQDREEIRRRKNQFRAHSAKKRQSSRPDLEEGEIEEEESSTPTNSSTSNSPAVFTPFKRLPTPVTPINELCPTFCTTGTTYHLKLGSRTSICPRIHNPKKLSICPAVLQGVPCAGLASTRCRLNHSWSFHIAPSCANYMMGCCYAMPCPYAHHDFVHTFSPLCEQFSKIGYCEIGHACHKIHWRGKVPEVLEMMKQKAKEDSLGRKLEVAKARAKESMKLKMPVRTLSMGETTTRELVSGGEWKAKPEVIVRGETTGELALQEDFVPF
ncbi:hypothetical protein OHC33_000673 [Knufia fluminis]|uniref:C3H1-type domain-containing protein n=1 Tax=Knufia fluminis TaxID=191047 RepID=A0AAN8ELW8_9EURO|nr:hypothetical protein OHC33_000673 [Knufia fluminis]